MPYLVHLNYRSKDVWVVTGWYSVQQKAEHKDICCRKTGISQWPLQTCKDVQMTDKAKKLWWNWHHFVALTLDILGWEAALLQQPNRSIFLHLHKVKITTLPWGAGDVPKQGQIKGNKFDIFACRQPQADKNQRIRETSWDRATAGPRCQHLTVMLVGVLQKLAVSGLSHSVTCCFFCLSSQYLVTPEPANITTAIMLAWLQEGCVFSRWEQILCQVRSQTTKQTPSFGIMCVVCLVSNPCQHLNHGSPTSKIHWRFFRIYNNSKLFTSNSQQ